MPEARKSDARHHLSFGRRIRLFVRLLGLTGILAAGVGAFILYTLYQDQFLDRSLAALHGEDGPRAQTAAYVAAGGAAAVALALLVELLATLALGTGGRSVAEASALLQMSLALAVVGAVNVYAFQHHLRWDLTRDKQFTLPADVVAELQKLRSPTTILVLQQHKTFGQLSEKPDAYDYAAERKVVEKVRDLVSQFQDLGRRFRVVVLDVEEQDFDKKLDEETRRRPGLKNAVHSAPENSIFFYADGMVRREPLEQFERDPAARLRPSTPDPDNKADVLVYDSHVQRLGFNEFYQLDKTASKVANGGRGNLVLLPQGVEAFTRKILAIEEKRPKVAVAVVHEWLTTEVTEGQELFTLAGMKKSLNAYGFDVVDLVLKRNWETADEPEPAAYTFQESKLERLEEELADVQAEIRGREAQLAALAEATRRVEEVKGQPFRKRNEVYRALIGRELDDEAQEQRVLRSLARTVEQNRSALAELDNDRQKAEANLRDVLKQERSVEDRRNNDVKAKLTRLLGDCDLLIVPRYTIINATIGSGIPSRLHRLSADQVGVIRDFMKSGKPVLACVGPPNEQGDATPRFEPLDDFEKLLGDRGVELGRQTVLFEGESKAFAARRAGNALGGSPAEIPSLTFEPPANPSGAASGETEGGPQAVNPIARAMQIIGRSVEQKLDIRIRALRPVYVNGLFRPKLPAMPEFVWTSPASWNEERPFPQFRRVGGNLVVAQYVPRFEATPLDDAKRGTIDEERRGPFPVGVALEAPMPVEWYDEEFTRLKGLSGLPGGLGNPVAAALTVAAGQKDRKTGRLAVVGHGGLFAGKDLTAANEKLLLSACNWLLGREDRLPRDNETWSYPRVQLDAQQKTYWTWGAVVGLPVLFAYLGVVMWLIRRVR